MSDTANGAAKAPTPQLKMQGLAQFMRDLSL